MGAAGISYGALLSFHRDVTLPVKSHQASKRDPARCPTSHFCLLGSASTRKSSTTKTRAFSPLRMTDKGTYGGIRAEAG